MTEQEARLFEKHIGILQSIVSRLDLLINFLMPQEPDGYDEWLESLPEYYPEPDDLEYQEQMFLTYGHY